MDRLIPILNRMPPDVKRAILTFPEDILVNLEEIRFRTSGIMTVVSSGRKYEVTERLPREVGCTMIKELLDSMLDYSYYSFEEDIAKGFITVEGGNRVGICGKAVIEGGKVTMLRDISSLNIRCGREIKGIADALKNIIFVDKKIRNTIIVSPPGCGKTTLLRDICRLLSYRGYTVGICDERSEIAGMYRSKPCYDIGGNCDVLDGCPKAEGIMMLIRSMSPDVIITDELGRSEDVFAIKNAVASGVNIIASIHGADQNDIKKSPVEPLIREGIFSQMIFLSKTPRPGTLKEIVSV